MAKKDEIITKVLKLLELGNEEKNSNPHEREMATRKAAELMAEYSIDFAELRNGNKPTQEDFIKIDVDGTEQVKVDYESRLAHLISKVFDCKIVNRNVDTHWTICFIGMKQDLEISIFFFKHLRRTVHSMATMYLRNDCPPLSRWEQFDVKRNYCLGMVETIRERLEELYKKREEILPSSCRDLMIVKHGSLEKAVDLFFPRRTDSHLSPISGDFRSFYVGKEDGKKVNLSRPIEGSGKAAAQIG